MRGRSEVAADPAFDVDALVLRLAACVAGIGLGTDAGNSDAGNPDDAFELPPAPGPFETVDPPTFGEDDLTAEARTRADAWLDRLPPGDASRRDVVYAAPDPDLLEPLAAFSLRLRAAWVIEPSRAAFVATARWVRPTILLAVPAELGALADAWDGGDRRWSRLRTIWVRPEAAGRPVSDDVLRAWETTFAAPVTQV